MGSRSVSGTARGALLAAALAALLLLAPGAPLAAPPLPAPATSPPLLTRPAYQVLRQNEDWSVLGAPNGPKDRDFYDPIKHIELNDSGSIWASLGAQARFRLEGWNNFNFGAPPDADHDDIYTLWRLMYHVDLHLGEHLRGFAQGKSAFVTDRDLFDGARTLDADELDLQNGFVDVILPLPRDGTVTLRTGRQEMLFGKQRLVSPLDWTNTRRTFDGISVIAAIEGWKITGFLSRLVRIRKYGSNDSNTDNAFYGVYAAGKVPCTDVGMDLYWLGLERDTAMFNGTTGREDRQTLGARFYGSVADTNFDYDIEAAYQLGRLGGERISAFMIGSQVGRAWPEAAGKPRVYAGYDLGSGDNRAAGGVQTFNQLYPLGHALLGYMDTEGRQNVSAPSLGVSFRPRKRVTLAAEGLYFWRADRNDGVYNAGGAQIRPGSAGGSKNVGAEIDLTGTLEIDRHTLLTVGYSHLFAGGFIHQSGPSSGIDWGYLALQYTF